MAVVLPHTGLIQPQVGDAFSTANIASNLALVDAAPGVYICTSGGRPSSWSSNQTGRWIFETDTGLTWYYDGSIFQRVGPSGYLKQVSLGGGRAVPPVTGPPRTTVLSLSYNVPAGGRAVRLDVYADASNAWTTIFTQQLNPANGNALAGIVWYLHGTGLPTLGVGSNTLAIRALQTTPTSFSVIIPPGGIAGMNAAAATADLSIGFDASNTVDYSYCSLTATEI